MTIEIYKNLAYLYYPKNIDNISDKENYINTIQYKNLINNINLFKDYKQDFNFNKLILEIKENKKFIFFNDTTLLNWEDRCVTLEIDIINNNILDKICINISLLLPSYTIYILEIKIGTNPFKWNSFPKRNKKKEENQYKQDISLLTDLIEKNLSFTKFPEKYFSYIINDINFRDIEMGRFNVYNAFFKDQNFF